MMFHGAGHTDPGYAWGLVPSFVLYADGRVIVAVQRSQPDDGSRVIREGRLDPAGVCALLGQIAADGFLTLKPSDYLPPGVTDHGRTTITLNAWQSNTISAYAFDVFLNHPGYEDPTAKVPAALMATARRLAVYSPPGAKLYQPDRLAVRLSLLGAERSAPPWPLSRPTLTELAANASARGKVKLVFVEGQAARDLYIRFANRVPKRYAENGQSYFVAIHPLLPYEKEPGLDGNIGWAPPSFATQPTTSLTCSSDVG